MSDRPERRSVEVSRGVDGDNNNCGKGGQACKFLRKAVVSLRKKEVENFERGTCVKKNRWSEGKLYLLGFLANWSLGRWDRECDYCYYEDGVTS